MRLAKALGAAILVLVVLAFFEWGQYAFIPTLIAIVAGIYAWRQLEPHEKTPRSSSEDDN